MGQHPNTTLPPLGPATGGLPLPWCQSEGYPAEGANTPTLPSLPQACRARGMRASFGEGALSFMRRQLQDWLDLSLHRGLPSSLLLLSRAFTITASVKDVAQKK